jgi:hypothetical protein
MATPNKNKHLKGTHISECKFRKSIKYFPLDFLKDISFEIIDTQEGQNV